MRRIIAIILACSLFAAGCGTKVRQYDETNAETIRKETVKEESAVAFEETESLVENEELHFTGMNDENFIQYVKEGVYEQASKELDSSVYSIESLEAVYVSKEYIQELEYNSKENVYFGYTLSELEQQFEGKRFVFTVGDDGTTVVEEVPKTEEFDELYSASLKNVAVGMGVLAIKMVVACTSDENREIMNIIMTTASQTKDYIQTHDGIANVIVDLVSSSIDQQYENMYEQSTDFMWNAILCAM